MNKLFGRTLLVYKRVVGPIFAFAALTAFLGSIGCSSSIFTGDKGNEFDSIKGTGTFNKACLGLDLSNAEIDVPTTRNLVRCLNSNGSIQEYQTFVESMSDAQLSILLRTVNDKLTLNYKRMKEVDRTFRQMDSQGLVVRAFNEMSKVMSNGKAIRSGVTLLHKG